MSFPWSLGKAKIARLWMVVELFRIKDGQKGFLQECVCQGKTKNTWLNLPKWSLYHTDSYGTCPKLYTFWSLEHPQIDSRGGEVKWNRDVTIVTYRQAAFMKVTDLYQSSHIIPRNKLLKTSKFTRFTVQRVQWLINPMHFLFFGRRWTLQVLSLQCLAISHSTLW